MVVFMPSRPHRNRQSCVSPRLQGCTLQVAVPGPSLLPSGGPTTRSQVAEAAGSSASRSQRQFRSHGIGLGNAVQVVGACTCVTESHLFCAQPRGTSRVASWSEAGMRTVPSRCGRRWRSIEPINGDHASFVANPLPSTVMRPEGRAAGPLIGSHEAVRFIVDRVCRPLYTIPKAGQVVHVPLLDVTRGICTLQESFRAFSMQLCAEFILVLLISNGFTKRLKLLEQSVLFLHIVVVAFMHSSLDMYLVMYTGIPLPDVSTVTPSNIAACGDPTGLPSYNSTMALFLANQDGLCGISKIFSDGV